VRSRATGAVIASVLATATVASAQHHHGTHEEEIATPRFRAGVTAIAARFDTMYYAGSYEGLGLGLEWLHAHGAAHVTIPLYRLHKNGATDLGAGDVMVGTHFTLKREAWWEGGVGVAATLPTGDETANLGMGHAMVMPSLWASVDGDDIGATVSLGYGRSLSPLEHDHGAGPLVEPMNGSEITGEVFGWLDIDLPVEVITRFVFAFPVGVDGQGRAYSSIGMTRRRSKLETFAELQFGISGDPFTIRGLVGTAVRF
jgi:hypothetical protein